MTGGLMNLVAYGNENLIFNGNPKKTYFKATYNKYTNFGLQRFRIDFKGSKNLNINSPTILNFKIPRYAELLYDTYIVINLPNIYSPLYDFEKEEGEEKREKNGHYFVPYEFRWIEELGTNFIDEIEIYSGGSSITKYSGEYLHCIKERDYNKSKKDLWDRMTGNISELNDPANANGNINTYPNVFFNDPSLDIEPSIRGRTLYIPLDAFFCESSKTALPLVALQYQEVNIKITLKPIMHLYTINNINDEEPDAQTGLSYRIKPNPNILEHQMWRFLQPPYDKYADTDKYNKNINSWNSDIHLMGTYIFLGQDERRIMAAQEHTMLIKQIFTYDFLDIAGSKIIELESKGMVSNYLWRFRRNDAFLRNEWSNYTNWPYNNSIPQNLHKIEDDENTMVTLIGIENGTYTEGAAVVQVDSGAEGLVATSISNATSVNVIVVTGMFSSSDGSVVIGDVNVGTPASVSVARRFQNVGNFYFTGNIGTVNDPYPINMKHILIDLGITMDGIYREKILPSGIYNYMEKYMRTTGDARDGIYCYNFCLNSNKREYQPSGAMNINKFKKVYFEFNTIETPLDPSGTHVEYICDLCGNAIGFRKTSGKLNSYNFDLRIFEERYNVLNIQGGRLGLMNAT